jgi:hypothetical protein
MAVGFAPIEATKAILGFVLIAAAAKVTRLQALAANARGKVKTDQQGLGISMNHLPLPLQIQLLRGEIADLSAAIHQLRRCRLDSASTQLLIAWKRAELEGLMRSQRTAAQPAVHPPATDRH